MYKSRTFLYKLGMRVIECLDTKCKIPIEDDKDAFIECKFILGR